MSHSPPEHFPGTLYDGDGMRLAGNGPPQITDELSDDFRFKTLLFDGPEPPEAPIELGPQDRLWVLPDSFGAPPHLPWPLVTELTDLIHAGRRVILAARDPHVGAEVRDTVLLLLNEPGGRA